MELQSLHPIVQIFDTWDDLDTNDWTIDVYLNPTDLTAKKAMGRLEDADKNWIFYMGRP